MVISLFKWEAKVERCEEEFNNISKMIKKEMERFEAVRVEEFKSVFIRYMEDQLKHQIQVSIEKLYFLKYLY